MDVQSALSQVKSAIITRKFAHARHLLRDVRMVANSRYVSGLATNTAEVLDAKSDYSVML